MTRGGGEREKGKTHVDRAYMPGIGDEEFKRASGFWIWVDRRKRWAMTADIKSQRGGGLIQIRLILFFTFIRRVRLT